MSAAKKKSKAKKTRTLSDAAAHGWAIKVEVATNAYGSPQRWTASATAAGSLCPRSVEIPTQNSYAALLRELKKAITTAGAHDVDWGVDRLTKEISKHYNSMIQLIEERVRKRHNLDLLWRSRDNRL